MPCLPNRHYVSFLVTLLGSTLATLPAQAQSITSADNVTIIQQTGDQYQIDGGNLSGDNANLFHSFGQFGLLTGESAQFSNPATVENIIGRVTGGDASIIDGLLAVDGDANLYLLNPAGIFFGENTQLNLGGSFSAATATGLNFDDQLLDALGSNEYAALNGAPTGYEFASETGALINTGDLAVTSGESLTLLGGQVINTGQLSAADGEVLVMAVPGENRVRLSQNGSLLGLELETLPGAAPTAAFTATTVPALLTGADALGMATDITVNPDGTISLSGSSLQIPTDAGTAIISGQLEADSGNIGILGEQIALVAADIDASGDAGGGTVLIGGDELGNGTVPNAAATIIDENSVVQADARDIGNGGKIVAWGTDLLRSAGQLFARGGNNGGDGGFIETSSLGLLEVSTPPDLSAVNGSGGLWLLDPNNILIVAGAESSQVGSRSRAVPPDGIFTTDFFPGSGPTLNSELGVDVITDSLTRGFNVSILTANGNITLETPLDFNDTGANTLRLDAGGEIRLQEDIFDSDTAQTSPDALNLELLANGNILITGEINSNGGSVSIDSVGGSVTTDRVFTNPNPFVAQNNGNITITAEQGISTGLLSTRGRNVTLETTQGSIVVNDNIFTSSTQAIEPVDAGDVLLRVPGGNINVLGFINASTTRGNGNGGSVTVDTFPEEVGGFAGDVNLRDIITNTSPEFPIISTNPLTLGDPIPDTNDAGDVFIFGSTISIGDSRNNSFGGFGGDVDLRSPNEITFRSIDASSLNGVGGNVTLFSGFPIVGTGTTADTANTIVGGTVSIRHTGGIVTPFDVGLGSTINGTFGAISTETDTLENLSIFGDFILGNIEIDTRDVSIIDSNSFQTVGEVVQAVTPDLVIGSIADPNTGLITDVNIDLTTGLVVDTSTNEIIAGVATPTSVSDLSLSQQLDIEFATEDAIALSILDANTGQNLGQTVGLTENSITGEITNPTADLIFGTVTNPNLALPIDIRIDTLSGLAIDSATGEIVGSIVGNGLDPDNLTAGQTIELAGQEQPVVLPIVDVSTGQNLGEAAGFNENVLTGELTNSVGALLPGQITIPETGLLSNVEIDSTTGLTTDLATGEIIGQTVNTADFNNLAPGQNLEIELATQLPANLSILNSSTGETIGQTARLTENSITGDITNPTANLVIGTIANPFTGALTNVEINTTTGLAVDTATGDPVGQVVDVAGLTNLATDQDIAITLSPPEPVEPVEPPETETPIPPAVNELAANCISDCGETDDSDDGDDGEKGVGPIPTGTINVLPAPELAIQQFERRLTTEVSDYLELEDNNNASDAQITGTDLFNTPDLPVAQNTLRQTQGQIGQRPALIYAVFGNAAEDANNVLQRNEPSDPLELLLVTADGEPKYIQLPTTRGEVVELAHRFRRQITSPSRVGTQTYLPVAQKLYQLLIAPLEEELEAQGVDTISFITDAGLRSLPIAALHDGENFLVENYNVGLMPSLSLTDLTHQDLTNVSALVAGTSVFADQIPLPSVPVELDAISSQWNSSLLQGDTFSLDKLQGERQESPYGIIHLATHGEFNAGDLSKSYLHLHNEKLGLDQLRNIGLHKPAVELITLSACQTALGSRTAELGFAGFAVLAGAKTAMASLWNVSDEASAGLMIEFYQQLQNEPIIKAEALRRAQLAMLRGEIAIEGDQLKLLTSNHQLPAELALEEGNSHDFSHPYYWAAFTMIGSPW